MSVHFGYTVERTQLSKFMNGRGIWELRMTVPMLYLEGKNLRRDSMKPTKASKLFDKHVRLHIYTHFLKTGQPPTAQETARALSSPPLDVRAAYQRLAEGRALVLQKDGAILMAEPFSAIPTPFSVEVGKHSWWGNCIWDALGIPAMLKEDARIITSCGCCGEAMVLEVKDGLFLEAPGVVHFALPPRDWWNDV